jgi:hypothetical protein
MMIQEMHHGIDDNQLSPASDRREVIALYPGTMARLDSVLHDSETREDLLSIAIEREIRRRQFDLHFGSCQRHPF